MQVPAHGHQDAKRGGQPSEEEKGQDTRYEMQEHNLCTWPGSFLTTVFFSTEEHVYHVMPVGWTAICTMKAWRYAAPWNCPKAQLVV